MVLRDYCFGLLLCLYLGSCVSQKKYNALIQARDQLELKATEYSINLAQERSKTFNLETNIENLTAQLNEVTSEHQRLKRMLNQMQGIEVDKQNISAKYEDMMDYFDIILNECDKDKIESARTQRQLLKKQDSLQAVAADLQALRSELTEQQQKMPTTAVEPAQVEQLYENVSQSLADYLSPGFTISKLNSGVMISIDESEIFESGSLNINEQGLKTVEQLAITLNGQENVRVLIIGHTDRTAISRKSKFLTDNWDWSVLKAAAFTRALTEAKLDPRIVTAAGRAFFDPAFSNLSEEGREKNKRTEIVIQPTIPGQANINMH